MSGFSIVEIMVGMVIALLATIVIFQVFGVSEGIKRTTTNGGDAQQNGAVVLLTLERSLREAGYGFNAADTSAVPVQLTVNASSAPDLVQVSSRPGWEYGPFLPDSAAFPSAVPPALSVETFSINSHAQLVSTVSGVSQPISDGIVQMKALYGTDSDGSGTVDPSEWGASAPASAMSVLAVAVGVVARSAQPEGKDRAHCTTTTAPPTWMNLTFDLSANLGLDSSDSWKCYRYKTFGVVVPLRNVLWKP
jgi:Tfp pilus assembly protein PilW